MTRALAGTQQPTRPPYFVPEIEADPVIRRLVSLPPAESARNDPAVTGASGQRYPVWAVYLNYLAAGQDVAATLANYGGDLSAEQVDAARRFASAYPASAMPYVDAALNG